MGDHVSIGQALIITGFSIVVVFLGLIIISMLISALKSISGNNKPEVSKAVVSPVKKEEPVVNEVDDEELVAVIAAAIAASMGVGIPQLNIKSIKRVPQTGPAWGIAGRQEQIAGKL